MFPQGGNVTDISNFPFPSSLQNTETRYFVLWAPSPSQHFSNDPPLNNLTGSRNLVHSYIRHFKRVGINATKFEKKRIHLKKRRFRCRRCCRSVVKFELSLFRGEPMRQLCEVSLPRDKVAIMSS